VAILDGGLRPAVFSPNKDTAKMAALLLAR